jgi:acetylornithine deacetylase/succinyl-diaminopimelate desuccinylase-like protein
MNALRLLVLAAGVGATTVTAPGPSQVRSQVRAWREAHEAQVLRELAGLLALPNLASDAEGIRRNAEAITTLLKRRGMEARLLEEAGAPPTVYAERRTKGARHTLAIYAHYDGQPVDPSRWASDPWRPVLRDAALEFGGKEVDIAGRVPGEWRLYARSASDDKAPIVAVAAALDALEAARAPLSVNLKLLFEGEEEAGSPHLRALFEGHAELLRADLWLLCDGPVHQSRRPQLYFGARGVAGLEITVYGPARALHSGHYGNWAPNPAALLAGLVASLRDADGRILVAGFSDDVRPPTDAEQSAAAAVPDADSALRAELQLAATEAGGARLAERILLPALNVRGLEAGRVGSDAANAIPTQARASIDFRLVPDQTPERLRAKVEAHVRAQGYHVVATPPDAETRRAHPRIALLEWGDGYPPARTPLDSPVALALVRSVEAALGAPVVKAPTLGGSVPMYLFSEVLRSPVIGLPVANHDNNQHAANENLRIQNLWDAIEIYAGVLSGLGPELRGARPAN